MIHEYEKRILDETQELKTKLVHDERAKFQETIASLNKKYHVELENVTEKLAAEEAKTMNYEQQIVILKHELEACDHEANSKVNMLKSRLHQLNVENIKLKKDQDNISNNLYKVPNERNANNEKVPSAIHADGT